MALSSSALFALNQHLAKTSQALATLSDVKRFVMQSYPSLLVEDADIKDELGESKWVVVHPSKYSRMEGSPIKPRVICCANGDYQLEVLLKGVRQGSWEKSEAPHQEFRSALDTLLASSGYVICPGILNYASEFGEVVRFQTKNLRVWTEPASRHDSVNCALWHKPSNTRIPVTSPLFNLCVGCKTLHKELGALKKRALAASPGHKGKWVDPSSNRPHKYLSPASQAQRATRGSQDRRNLRKVVLRYEEDALDIELSPDQDDEMGKLVTAIQENGKEHLEAIYAEAEQAKEGGGEEVRQTWERDMLARKDFFQDQLKNRRFSSCNDLIQHYFNTETFILQQEHLSAATDGV